MALLSRPAAADWPADPLVNVLLSGANNAQTFPQTVADGTGGAISTWRDDRADNGGIYAQRISADGTVRWATNGVAVCTNSSNLGTPGITSDGAGGAVVVWQEIRTGRIAIFAQRISVDGAAQWALDGVALSTAAGNQVDPAIVTDGAGGAIATWFDGRNGNWDIYAQRISADGIAQWTVEGVALCNAPGGQTNATLTSDNAGGAIVTWVDSRIAGSGDVYAQRVSASGAVQWTPNGVTLCSASGYQLLPMIISDGNSGAIVAWYDPRNGSNDVYAQRVSSDGIPQWGANGVALCVAAGNQDHPKIVSDGVGGAIATWYDYRAGDSADIYAQRVAADGAVKWQADGTAICVAAGNQIEPYIASDGMGGGIITWYDFRSSHSDIYAQRIAATGEVQWLINGMAVCTAVDDQLFPTIAAAGKGMAIVTWQDERIGGGNDDIYAQRVPLTNAPSNVPETAAFSLRGYPNPFNPKTTIAFEIPNTISVSLRVFDVSGRLVRVLVDGEVSGQGRNEVVWNGRDDTGKQVAAGVYFYRLDAGDFSETKRMALVK